MSTADTKWVSALVPADLTDQFKQIADAHDRSVAAELRRAMKRHVDAEADVADESREVA